MIDDDLPMFEGMHTKTDERREHRKRVNSRVRKSSCAKRPFTKKQALGEKNKLIRHKHLDFYLGIYKCRKCRCYHLTHSEPRGARKG